jgi:hypothetical protein
MNWGRRRKRRRGLTPLRVGVRRQIPWHVRTLLFVLAGAAVVGAGWWTYDIGRNLGGFHSGQAAAEHARQGEQISQLRDENEKLHSRVTAAERQVQIGLSTQNNLTGQLKVMSDENAKLKDDLAFFQTLMTSGSPGTGSGITINRFRVRRDALPGEYRYQLLVVQSRSRSKGFQGRLQLVIDVNQDGREQVLVLPGQQARAAAYDLNFKFYQRVEGAFNVPDDARVTRVQVRVLEAGSDVPRSTQSVTL